MQLQLSAVLIELVASLLIVEEGESLIAYKDGGGIWTDGIGHTGPDVKPGVIVTDAQAVENLIKDEEPIFDELDEHEIGTGKVLGNFATAAYVSFGINCGSGALRSVLTGESQIEHYVHDHKGNIEPGLVRRRRLEKALIAADV